ncbi:allose ABC transporter membrane protein [Alkalibaculum bacchi]|uniref:Allose ABC transporter membrane protein n=1 Tax=Alkalibaculum bacchi TaxID=645887 RepID=A0A366I1Y0_9FIRM|nr:D-allose ABC transporter permease [Alkalibaculum bacchi]RBP61345.1 allose ABC transporter membrane protein [Alkalibaculum bacchi]
MSKKMNLSQLWENYGTFIILLAMVAIFGIISPDSFFNKENFIQILLQSSVTILIACGEFFAILIAGIDLSVGSILALSGMVTGKLLVAGISPIISILLGGILLGAVLGAINGTLVNVTKLHPFIITLGTNSIYRGFTLIISDARPIFGFDTAFSSMVSGWLWVIPKPVIIAVVVALILTFITNKTKLGRNIYAMGGNKEAAWYSGINVNMHTLIVFIISGVCAGIAGVVLTARLGSAEPLAATGYETFAIASAIIGGTSFFGGKGVVLKVLVGGIIIGTISNGLNMLAVPTYYQQIVMGALIIGAVTLERVFGATVKGK